jgi:hypothetical protein
MLATMTGRLWMLALVVALIATACGDGGGDDDRACRPCVTSDGCEKDQECVLAVDGEQRCFETDEATCKLDRVEVARAPTPSPTATP